MTAGPSPPASENAAGGCDQRRSLAARARERSASRQQTFLKALEGLGTIQAACLASRVGRRTVYDWVEKDKHFADAFQLARDVAADVLEAEARRRGLEGVAEPVFFQGAVVGHVTRYSDACLMALLSAYRPERFGRRRAAKPDASPRAIVHVSYD